MRFFKKLSHEIQEIKKSDPIDVRYQKGMANSIAKKPIKEMGLMKYLKIQKERRKADKTNN